MIRKKAEQRVEIRQNQYGGQGQITITYGIEKQDHNNERFHLFGKVTVSPGASVGLHNHTGKTEAICILEGVCLYGDNDGEQHALLPGDCAIVSGAGDEQQMYNPGPEPMVYMVAMVTD